MERPGDGLFQEKRWSILFFLVVFLTPVILIILIILLLASVEKYVLRTLTDTLL